MVRQIVVAVVLAVAAPAIAGQHAPNKSNPYRNLFKEQSALQKAVQAAAPKADPKPTVVCGMTIVPADPSIDPKMLVPRKADGVDYTIRVITPAICNPSR